MSKCKRQSRYSPRAMRFTVVAAVAGSLMAAILSSAEYPERNSAKSLIASTVGEAQKANDRSSAPEGCQPALLGFYMLDDNSSVMVNLDPRNDAGTIEVKNELGRGGIKLLTSGGIHSFSSAANERLLGGEEVAVPAITSIDSNTNTDISIKLIDAVKDSYEILTLGWECKP